MCRMKLVYWNVRGLGALEKRREVHLLVGEKLSSILCLQETKMQCCDDFLCACVWGSNPHSYSFRPSVGALGGCARCGIVLRWRFGIQSAVIIFCWFMASLLNPMRNFICSMCMLCVINGEASLVGFHDDSFTVIRRKKGVCLRGLQCGQ